MKTEWRIVVYKGHYRKTYPKRDQAHADLGVERARRDFELYDEVGTVDTAGWDVWIETRQVSDWTRASE